MTIQKWCIVQRILNLLEYGNGARGIVRVHRTYITKTGKTKSTDHVFNVINPNGEILYIDAQIGKKKDIFKILGKYDADKTYFMRTDNLKLTNKALEYVEVRKK